MAWTWRFASADGTEITPAGVPEAFTSQEDAESWINDARDALLGEGIDLAKLSEDGAELYAVTLSPSRDS
ncbi:hypothetical protein ACIBEA_42570 [Streptomyces sp. NPDC051555]|uniref:hypothetical protein n=1 Tax=Streptomyces sp. NPDC051555 TaxID=3365657 RepID=UPI00378DE373